MPPPTSRIARFLNWWRDGLAASVPAAARRLWRGDRALVVVTPKDGGYRLAFEKGGRTMPIEGGRVVAEADVAEVLDRSRRGRVGVRLGADRCLVRHVELPAAALNDLDAILALELERVTPFRAGDVVATHFLDGRAQERGKVRVAQALVKRSVLAAETERLKALGVDAAFADAWADRAEQQALPVDFLAAAPSGGAGRRGGSLRLALLLAALVTLAAGYTYIGRHDAALAALREETAAARAKAAAHRAALAESETSIAAVNALDAMHRAQPSVVQVLDDVTRLLPDDVYLSELRTDGAAIMMTGHARSATELLALFEGSPAFEEARFTAPVRLEPNENRERFSLKVRVRRNGERAVR